MLYQQLKALYWANLLMNLSTKPLYKIRSGDSWSFRITKVCYSTMSNTSATANQDKKLMNKCCKVHRLPQKLSDLLLESPFDDDCKKTQQQMLLKNWNWLTSNFNDRLRIFMALRKKSGRKLTSFERRKLVWDFWHL